MSTELKPSWGHQLQARNRAHQHYEQGSPGYLLAMAMGTGKTKVAIDLVDDLALPLVLVVCPIRVIEVWRYQLAQHAGFPYLFTALDEKAGSIADKTRLARDRVAQARVARQTCFIAINYESAWHDPFASWALNTIWPLVIADEIHRIKSPSGKASRFMGRLALRSIRRLGLSGTPLPHSPLDIWAEYRFLDPSIYDDTFHSFKTRYAEWGGFQNRQVTKWREMEDFNQKFYSIAYRVTKEEALDLPDQLDVNLYADFATPGRQVYDQLESEFIAWLGETPEEQITVANALVLLLRLQQLTGGTLKDDTGTEHVVDTAKEMLLSDWLEDLPLDEPVVIFANFLADLDAIRRACERAGHTHAEVSGRSPDGIQLWKNGMANVLAAQIRVGAEGQDFTRSKYIVYYSTGFWLSSYLQSRDRIHRPGQTRAVTYYHLLVRNSIDEIVLRALENRWDLVESVLKEMRKNVSRRLPAPINHR